MGPVNGTCHAKIVPGKNCTGRYTFRNQNCTARYNFSCEKCTGLANSVPGREKVPLALRSKLSVRPGEGIFVVLAELRISIQARSRTNWGGGGGGGGGTD